MSEQAQEIMTVKEIQDILKISKNTAYNLVHSEGFPAIKIGHTYRVPRDRFYEWLRTSFAIKT